MAGLLGAIAIAAGGLTAGTAAAAESRDKVRLDLLDSCVYDQWTKRTVKDTIVDDCRCAAETAAGQFSDDQVDKFNGRLTGSVRPLWQEAFDDCFES